LQKERRCKQSRLIAVEGKVQTITFMGSLLIARLVAGGLREGAPAGHPFRFNRRVRLHGGPLVGWPLFCGQYTVKKIHGFPVPSRDVTAWPNSPWPEGRVCSVSSRLGTGKPLIFFLQCNAGQATPQRRQLSYFYFYLRSLSVIGSFCSSHLQIEK
jgi:hypothetical protein